MGGFPRQRRWKKAREAQRQILTGDKREVRLEDLCGAAAGPPLFPPEPLAELRIVVHLDRPVAQHHHHRAGVLSQLICALLGVGLVRRDSAFHGPSRPTLWPSALMARKRSSRACLSASSCRLRKRSMWSRMPWRNGTSRVPMCRLRISRTSAEPAFCAAGPMTGAAMRLRLNSEYFVSLA